MPITSWKLTLSPDKQEQKRAILALNRHPFVEIGPFVGESLAIVVESVTLEQDAEIGVWLTNLRGVVAASLVFVDFSDVETFDRKSFAAACAAARGSRGRPSRYEHVVGIDLNEMLMSTVGNLTKVDNAGRTSKSGLFDGDDHVSR